MPQASFRLDLAPTPRLVLIGFAALALFVPGDSGSENTTLSASYPPPAGIYSKLLVTGQAGLAQNGGGVAVGTNAAPNAGLIIEGGNLGIGTTSPSDLVEVDPAGGCGGAGGQCGVLVSGGSPALTLGSGGALSLNGGNLALTGTGATLKASNGSITVDSAGRVGIGQSSPQGALDVNGTIVLRGNNVLQEMTGGVGGSGNGPISGNGGNVNCTGGQVNVNGVCSCQPPLVWDGVSQCVTPTGTDQCQSDSCPNTCPPGATPGATTNTCSCPGGATWSGAATNVCLCADGATYNTATYTCDCANGASWNGSACVCSGTAVWNSGSQTCTCPSGTTYESGVGCVTCVSPEVVCAKTGSCWDPTACDPADCLKPNYPTCTCVTDLKLCSGCFVDGTPVLTPSGPVAIDKIRPGDVVFSVDERTFALVPKKVLDIENVTTEIVMNVAFSNGVTMGVTPIHRFYDPTTGRYKAIGEFHVGDEVAMIQESAGLSQGPEALRCQPAPRRHADDWLMPAQEPRIEGAERGVRIVSMTRRPHEPTAVHNLHLEGPYHNYLVNGMLVHNTKLGQ